MNANNIGRVHTGIVFVDGIGVGDVGNIVLRDRKYLSSRWYGCSGCNYRKRKL